MQSIKVENPFKGLLTNGNDREINFSYFADMDKVKVSKKYLQSEEYKLEDFGTKPEIRNVIEIKVVYLDDDKWWNKNKISMYVPDFQRHYIVFSTTKVYVYKDNPITNTPDFETSILEQSLIGYVKSFELGGVLRILTTKGIYNLQYKRINDVKTLLCQQINNGIINDTLSATVATTSTSTVNPEITFDVVPQAQIYWIHETYTNTELKNSLYRISAFDVIDNSSGTNNRYECYMGTIYLVRANNNIFKIPTQGFYDFTSVTTFLFIPVALDNGEIRLLPTVQTYLSIIKTQNESFSNFVSITPDGSLGLPDIINVDHNNVMQFGLTSLSLANFTSRFESTEPLVTTIIPYPFTNEQPVFLEELLNWLSNPNVTHRIVGSYTLDPANYGFDVSAGNLELLGTFIQTIVINGTDEYIIATGKISTPVSASRVIYSIQPIKDLPLLATHSKIYIGFGSTPENYELVKTVEIFKGESFAYKEYFGYADLSGILLSNVLAIYGDIKNFSYVVSGSDYVIINNIGFMIEGSVIYYSPNDITNAVFYKNRYIPNVYGDALISIGGMLGVIRYNKDVTLISIQVIENEIYFKIYDTVSFVIKDRDSFLEIPDGVLMSLRDGLYLSTPQERQLLSEPINDIFEEGKVTKLLYDDYNRRIMVQASNDIYVFDLINKVWLKFKNLQLRNIAFDGENVITIDGSSFAKVILSNDTEGRVTFHKVSLGNNKLLKRLIGLRIDLDGTLTTFTDSYGHSGSLMQSNEQLERRIEEFYIHLNNQSPTVGLDFTIGFKGKIYSIEILYEVIGEFVSTYDKIYYPPIEETIVVQNNTPAIPNPPPTEDFITNLSNKTLWFKPENISGLTWTDEITGREWQTDTGVDIPTVALNGYDVFYSSARALCNTVASAYTVIGTDNSWTLMGVFKLVSGNAIFNYLSNSVTGVMTLNTDAGASQMYLRDTGSDELLIASIDDQNVWGCMIITYDNTTKTLRFRLDDIDESSVNLNYNQVAVTLEWTRRFWLNGSTTSENIVTPNSIGENGIAEFFIATGIKTDSELANAKNWLKFKYGV